MKGEREVYGRREQVNEKVIRDIHVSPAHVIPAHERELTLLVHALAFKKVN